MKSIFRGLKSWQNQKHNHARFDIERKTTFWWIYSNESATTSQMRGMNNGENKQNLEFKIQILKTHA